jgi:hypothetical protein
MGAAVFVVATVASALISGYGAYQQAQTAKATGKFEAAQAAADAKATEGAAQVEAERLRKAGRRQQAAAIAQAAANGVDINSPTAVKIDQQIGQNAEQDAYMTILNGQNDAARVRQGGQAALLSSKAEAQGYMLQGASTLISAAGSVASNWKKSPKAAVNNFGVPAQGSGSLYNTGPGGG